MYTRTATARRVRRGMGDPVFGQVPAGCTIVVPGTSTTPGIASCPPGTVFPTIGGSPIIAVPPGIPIRPLPVLRPVPVPPRPTPPYRGRRDINMAGLRGLGCAGCGGRCKRGRKTLRGLGFDTGDFASILTAGANAAATLYRTVDGSGSPASIVTPTGQVVSTQNLSAAQIASLQAQLAQQNTNPLASISPTMWFVGVLAGLGLVVVATR